MARLRFIDFSVAGRLSLRDRPSANCCSFCRQRPPTINLADSDQRQNIATLIDRSVRLHSFAKQQEPHDRNREKGRKAKSNALNDCWNDAEPIAMNIDC